MKNLLPSAAALFVLLAAPLSADVDPRLAESLDAAGPNRAELERALAEVPSEQRFAMEWLVARMPERDRAEVDAAFLLEHVDEAYRAWQSAAWRDLVPREVFLDAVLPYASISERRDAWRDPMRELAVPIVAGASTPAAAAIRQHQQVFPKTGVKYSTKRRRADQSSAESIESGLASCSGLSIVLIDACRSVGVPARFVGVPMWSDGSGNHSWVEIWDGERWRFTGAAEPTGDRLDEAWFTERARTCVAGDPRHGIYAVSWGDSPVAFPMSFDGRPSPSRAIDVTERYLAAATPLPEGHGRVRIRVTDGDRRVAAALVVSASDGKVLLEGTSKDERFDANDHLLATLPIGTAFTVSAAGGEPVRGVLESESMLVDLVIDASPAAAEPKRPSAAPDPKASRAAVNALARSLRADGIEGAADPAFANVPLTEEDVARASRVLVDAWERQVKRDRMSAIKEGVVEIDGLRMPIWYQTYGDKPRGGRSLFISMHGGGGAPPEVNSQQWENQKRLYRPAEGVYLAPRAPTDTWNLWHQGHIDRFFDRLI
ncbi:MAG: transglutaminase-like domain-containing protein, partial [Phycisphaerales bacterium]